MTLRRVQPSLPLPSTTEGADTPHTGRRVSPSTTAATPFVPFLVLLLPFFVPCQEHQPQHCFRAVLPLPPPTTSSSLPDLLLMALPVRAVWSESQEGVTGVALRARCQTLTTTRGHATRKGRSVSPSTAAVPFVPFLLLSSACNNALLPASLLLLARLPV